MAVALINRKPLFKLIVYFENNVTNNRQYFRTTESIRVNNKQEAMEILSDFFSSYSKRKVKKAFYNGEEIKLPE